MDLRERAFAEEKPRRRGSGTTGAPGEGSKKSTRRKPSSTSRAAVPSTTGTGGDRARGNGIDSHRDSISSGGLEARPDLGAAPGKDSNWSDQAGSGSRARSGAKGVRRGSGREGAGGRDGRGGLGREQREAVVQREQQPRVFIGASSDGGGGSGGGSGVDRAILQKWKSDASATVAEGGGKNLTPFNGRPDPKQDATETAEVDDEDNGGGYEDEGFEEYSDEFDGEDEGPSPAGGTKTMTAATAVIRPGSARGAAARAGGGGGVAMVSPALKMKETGANDGIQAPRGKALEELRESLREENNIARERKAEAKSSSGSSQATRGAKDAKGTKSAAAVGGGGAAVGGGGAVARGKFSVDTPLAEKKKGRRRSSGFKMADAKALTRALAKGDPRTERVLAIRSAYRFEVESARLFDQAPILPIDLYHRRLRGQLAMIRQAGSQTNEDARSVDVQTDEIFSMDKEAQFHLGHDDTALENLMRRLRSNRRGPADLNNSPSARMGESKVGDEGKRHQRTVAEEDGAGSSTTIFKGLYNSNAGVDQDTFPAPRYGNSFDNTSSGVSGLNETVGEATVRQPPPPPLRLGKFLRQASVMMETLCEENLLYASAAGLSSWGQGGRRLLEPAARITGDEEANDDREGRSLFSERGSREGEGWEQVGGTGTWCFGQGVATIVDAGRRREEEKRSEANGVGVDDALGGFGGLLEGSKVVGIAFSRVKRSMLVTAHARPADTRRRRTDGSGGGGEPPEVSEHRAVLQGCGAICVWNADNPEAAPVGVLSGEGLFSCLCLPLHHSHVVVAGTAEGCLLLWDLREPASSSRAEESRGLGLRCGIRPPTYTTAGGGGGDAGLAGPGCGHASTIVSVIPIPVAEGGGGEGGGISGSSSLGGEGLLSLGEANSFQVASLDDRGTVSIWLASEVPRTEEGGSQTDLGLSPGGRIRLALSKSLRPGTRPQSITPGGGTAGTGPEFSVGGGELTNPSCRRTAVNGIAAATARAIAFSPGDPNRLLVGDSSNYVMHASRLGDPPPPRAYRPTRRRRWGYDGGHDKGGREQEEGAMGGVACLTFSPFFHEYFLAGCGDGSVRLYKDDSAFPLAVWQDFSADTGSGTNTSGWPPAISSVAWSEHRPAVFFVLDASGALHAFDLLQHGAGAVATERPPRVAAAGAVARDRLPGSMEAFTMAESVETACRGGTSMALSTETLATGSRPKLALAFGGRVFMRTLAGRMFRQSKPPPLGVMGGVTASDRSRQNPGGVHGSDEVEVAASEGARMKEWLGEVLWA